MEDQHQLSGEQLSLLRQSVAEFVARESVPDRLARLRHDSRTFDPQLYEQAAGLGWLGVLVPEEHGGLGLGVRECAAIFEELGRVLMPGPFFASAVLAPLILLRAGSGSQQAGLLPALADGSARVAFCLDDDGRPWGEVAGLNQLVDDGSGLRLQGRCRFVQDVEAATTFICLATDRAHGGSSLLLVPRTSSGVSVTMHGGMMLQGVGEVAFDDVPGVEAIGPRGGGWTVLDGVMDKAVPILCAFIAGACSSIFETTLIYTRERFAFGQPIGRFQRVQDHMVELANHTDAVRLLMEQLLADDAPPLAMVHEAKAVASEAYYQACNDAHMVHAGPGTDLDHPLMAHTILSRQLYQFLGSPATHKRRMMDLLYPVGAAGDSSIGAPA